MKRSLAIILFGLLTFALWMLWREAGQRAASSQIEQAPVAPVIEHDVPTYGSRSAATAQPHRPLLGETILRGYGHTNQPAANDLVLLSRLMENSLLLLKSAADQPLSDNEDWAGLLCGRNGVSERFLPADHVILNSQGQLVDRWHTPLFFHALGGRRYELRSAGPDQTLWTEDDIQRNADGSFARGNDLNAQSLFKSATVRR